MEIKTEDDGQFLYINNDSFLKLTELNLHHLLFHVVSDNTISARDSIIGDPSNLEKCVRIKIFNNEYQVGQKLLLSRKRRHEQTDTTPCSKRNK
jgi:hypothetical protein